MNRRIKRIVVTAVLITAAACSSVYTVTSVYEGMDESVGSGDFSSSLARLENAKDDAFSKKDRVLYYLNTGMLAHYTGDYNKSNEYLTQAERAIEELYTVSAGKLAASFLLNDNALDYSGEDYEDIYLNVFKALNYAHLGSTDAAFVEINRISQKLNGLEGKYTDMSKKYQSVLSSQVDESSDKGKLPTFNPGTLKYHNSGIGRTLSLLLYRYERDYDDAIMDYRKLKEAFSGQPHIYSFPLPKITPEPKRGSGVPVTVMAFHGLGPVKKPAVLRITTFDGFVTVSSTEPKPFSENISWPSKSGYHFKFSLPYLSKRPRQIKSARLRVDGGKTYPLQMLENMNEVAVTTFELKAPLIYLKSVARTVIKGIAAEKAKEKMNDELDNPFLGALAGFATDIAVDVSENADLRISRFFPGQVSIADITLPPGSHSLKVEYLSPSGSILHVHDLGTTEIVSGRLNLFESFCLK